MAARGLAKVLLAFLCGQPVAGSDGGLVSLVQSTHQVHEASTWPFQGSDQRSKKLHSYYAPTEIQVDDGVWVECHIRGKGTHWHSYNVEVRPRGFAAYNMTNVPADMLKQVKLIRGFIPVEAKSAVAAETEEEDEDASIHLKVRDSEGGVMKFKMLRRSPLRTLMKMSCDRSGISWFKCQRHAKFSWMNTELSEADRVAELGLEDGDMIKMQLL
eukprot:CAMPEP_0175210510 /NCGR_PEP_ID=MMETSP0093-20121207/14682_1 /TAXON_ID=311494 /ORGANISM="Alexandrium monilatum, Strain CCMP3105" /LENGTH=213 /DNA_ID=CAMNT_0016503741 /DNA_START=66 /DNA_END=707 /DNA_ORIENTATION=-